MLVIAPLRVARDTWPAEVEKWDHLADLDCSVIVGDLKTRTAAVNTNALIYIVNRENVKWLVEYYEKQGLRWDLPSRRPTDWFRVNSSVCGHLGRGLKGKQ